MIITPTSKSTKRFPVGTITTRRKDAKWDRTKIGVGNSVTVKFGEIDEKTREGKNIRMKTDLVGL